MRKDTLHDAIKQLKEDLDALDYVIRQVEAAVEGRPLRGRPPRAIAQMKKARENREGGPRDNDP